jgi:putative SOS response-associated peptidase YedK
MRSVEAPGPTTPTMADILAAELHLVISCAGCRRSVRLTPLEAVDDLGAACTILQARARLRCVWCGSRKPLIDVRPCSVDMSAKAQVEVAEREARMWPGDPRLAERLEEARRAWELRRPRDNVEAMCNLYSLNSDLAALVAAFEADLGLRLTLPAGEATLSNQPWATTVYPKYQGLFVRPVDPKDPAGDLEPAVGRWGLVPFFHKGPLKEWKAATNNCRSETMATSGSFREAVKARRCIIPATAICEWSGPQGSKTKHFIGKADGSPLYLAGLWASHTWEGERTESYTMVMQETLPGDDMHAFHTRQPVFLDRAGAATWINCGADYGGLLCGPPSGTLVADPPEPVSV